MVNRIYSKEILTIHKIIDRLDFLFSKKIITWHKNIREYQYLRSIIKNYERKNLINKNIVINATFIHKFSFDILVFLGMQLALNGAKVKILLDDGVLKHSDFYLRSELPKRLKNFEKTNLNQYYYFKYNRNLLDAIIYRNIVKNAIKTYKVKNLEFIYFSEILNNNKLKVDCKGLKKNAMSSTIRFFETCELDFNKREVKYYYKLSLLNAILSKKIGFYILHTLKPDLYITHHGIYSTHGPAYDFLKEKGVKGLVFNGINKRFKNTSKISFTDAKTQLISRDTYWQKFKNVPVSEQMISKVTAFFEDRVNFSAWDNKIYYSGDMKNFVVNKNDGYKYHLAIFPNVIWDGNIEERHNVFEGYLDWLITTIKLLKNNKDIKLYVRAHPSEATMYKHSSKILDILKKHIDFSDAKNIVLIPSHENINPYAFVKSGIDLGLVYDGTLAFELPLLKVPAIVVVKGGRFTIEDGDYVAKSKEQYFEYLNNIDKIIKDFHENYEKYYLNIVRFIYWFMFEISVDLPILNRNKIDIFNLKKGNLKLDEKLLKLIEIYTK